MSWVVLLTALPAAIAGNTLVQNAPDEGTQTIGALLTVFALGAASVAALGLLWGAA